MHLCTVWDVTNCCMARSLIEPVCAPLAVDIMDGLAVVSLPPATRYTRMAWSSGLVERDALSYL